MRAARHFSYRATAAAALRQSLLRTVNRCGPIVGNNRLRAAALEPNGIIDDAVRRAGHDDFGADDFLQPLRVLLAAYRREADLTLIGRLSMREDLVSLLVSRLRIESDRKRFQGIPQTGIRAPLFITGLPRSGTTFLHTLLAADPGWRAPAGWEVMYPSPPPGQRPDPADPRRAMADRRMKKLYWLAPEFRVIHELDAALPQECIAITAGSFMSDVFHTMCHVPGYQRWLDDADPGPAYRYHRRFLQQLQGAAGEQRWLLKAPAHLFSLRALLRVYPDARIAFMLRDPREVLPSLASLTLVLRSAFSDRHEPALIGKDLLRHWARGVQEARQTVAGIPDRHSRFIEIQYSDLTARPLETVQRLYAHLGIDFSDAARHRMRSCLQQRPKDRYGTHRYTLQQFGLQPAEIDSAFAGCASYCV